jgi:23S rRNA (uracil1939-C5)-methyltransferase
MLTRGQLVRLVIEKPAAGGAMIARAAGQIVLVLGAIPGEEASVHIDRVGKGVAFGRVVDILQASPSRRVSAADPDCGGCLYAHIDYPRQLTLKAEVVADAFARIAKHPLSAPIDVMASPETGYRMRARLHVRNARWGFYREGTHDLCDARSTGQLRADTCDVLDRLCEALGRHGVTSGELELSENRAATERAIHWALGPSHGPLTQIDPQVGVSGLSVGEQGRSRTLFGDAHVTDMLRHSGREVSLRRHVLAFFQGNRYLLGDLVSHVVGLVSEAADVVDLYAGAGLFSAPLAAQGVAVSAVEGDPVSARDLKDNAKPFAARLQTFYEPVETFVTKPRPRAQAMIVDPPRTGMSKEALTGVVKASPPRLVYVSCDIATLARDTRALLDGGYQIGAIRAFDLFPNTPHVETVVRFDR